MKRCSRHHLELTLDSRHVDRKYSDGRGWTRIGRRFGAGYYCPKRDCHTVSRFRPRWASTLARRLSCDEQLVIDARYTVMLLPQLLEMLDGHASLA